MQKSIIKIIALILIVGLNWSGIFAVSETIASFNDTEKSENNSFEIGILDLSLEPGEDFTPEVTPTQNSLRNITVSNQGSLDFQYKMDIENLSGDADFCNILNLKVILNNNILYNNTLSGFHSDTFTDLGDLHFELSSNVPQLDKTCGFDFIFTAWQVNLADENLGFNNVETVSNVVESGQDIVLNEFLPNPEGYDGQDGLLGEWVEIYNNSGQAIDLTGWYVEDAVGASHRQTIATGTTYNEQVVIGAKNSGSEWLVLFMGGQILNNDGDTITLYDNTGALADEYTYSGSTHYNNNETPDQTNNLAVYLPFNNDFNDQSGNDNDGVNYGTEFTSSGRIDEALEFDNTDYVEIADDSSLDIVDEITLEAWVYPTAWDSAYENSILTKGGDSDWGVWNLHHTNSGFRLELAGQQIFESSPSAALDTWYHVVGVYDGVQMKLYVNGALSGSKAVTGPIAENDSPLRIGKQFWWGDYYSYWQGLIDEVKIYNRALDAPEVLDHYNTANSSSSEVPINKSYARIPDGIGDWVDPIPTPGAANILTEDAPKINKEIDQTEDSLEADLPAPDSTPALPADAGIEQELSGYDSNGDFVNFVIKDNFTPIDSDSASALSIVINEFLAEGDAFDEFIEIYNASSSDINISGWQVQIKNNNGTTTRTIASNILPARSWAAIYFADNILLASGAIILLDYTNQEIDKVAYYNAITVDKSFARVPDGSFNWARSIPSPTQANTAVAEETDEDSLSADDAGGGFSDVDAGDIDKAEEGMVGDMAPEVNEESADKDGIDNKMIESDELEADDENVNGIEGADSDLTDADKDKPAELETEPEPSPESTSVPDEAEADEARPEPALKIEFNPDPEPAPAPDPVPGPEPETETEPNQD